MRFKINDRFAVSESFQDDETQYKLKLQELNNK